MEEGKRGEGTSSGETRGARAMCYRRVGAGGGGRGHHRWIVPALGAPFAWTNVFPMLPNNHPGRQSHTGGGGGHLKGVRGGSRMEPWVYVTGMWQN